MFNSQKFSLCTLKKFFKAALPITVACSVGSLSTVTLAQEASEEFNNRLIEVKGQIQSINEELSSQRATLGSLKTELASQNDNNSDFHRDSLKEMKALRRQIQSLTDSIFGQGEAIKSGDLSAVKPLRNYDLQTPDGKMYMGEDEYVYIKEADTTFDARIDTGAAVSSISALNITEFERKGKKWYRFTIKANDQEIEVEAPFVRSAQIRQSSKHTVTDRVVVSLNVKVGDYSTQSEFTLTDRTRLQYPLLIGRTLLQDIAVVDVARDHIQGRNKDTFLILSREDYESNMKKGIDVNAEYKQKRANAEGQIAYPSENYGANLGTNSEKALPAVRNKGKEENNNKATSKPKSSGEVKGEKDAKAEQAEIKEDKKDNSEDK